MTTTASIGAKGCDKTGITEDLAEELYHHPGRTFMAIVEIESDGGAFTKKGDHKTKLNLLTIEPAANADIADHLRNLQQQCFYERRLVEDGPELFDPSDGPAPKVADILAAGERFLPHDFISGSLSTDDNPVCDICGQVADTALHQAEDPDDADDDTPVDEAGDPADEPHEYVPIGDDLDQCDTCGDPKTAPLHTDTTHLDNPFTVPSTEGDDAA